MVTNHQLLLSLPFREGTGVLTKDVAKPQHQDVDLVGPPTWTRIGSGLGVLDLNGATDYLDCPAANTLDLAFTSEDYSITCWVYPQASVQSRMVIAKYALDIDGWELYLYTNGAHEYLTLRHHHAPDRTGCYSDDWASDAWHFMGITRSGAYPLHYRNGREIDVTYDVGGLLDPDAAAARDLVVGCRFTKDADWYTGQMWDPRVWLGALSPVQMMALFNMDRHWFGL